MTAAILLLAFLPAAHGQAPRLPQTTLPARPDAPPTPVAKTCLCSGLCSCGCNDGRACSCPAPTVQEMLGEIKRYHDEGKINPGLLESWRVVPRSTRPVEGWRTVPRYRPTGGGG
jgi:hypothetical protein